MTNTVRRSRLPENFSPTDDMRTWCAKLWQRPMIADAICPAFLRYHHDQIEDGRPALHLNWQRALQTWIRRASPGGSMHSRREWEDCLSRATLLEGEPKRSSPQPHYTPRGPKADADPLLPAGEIMRQTAQKAAGRDMSPIDPTPRPKPAAPSMSKEARAAAALGLVAARAALKRRMAP